LLDLDSFCMQNMENFINQYR